MVGPTSETTNDITLQEARVLHHELNELLMKRTKLNEFIGDEVLIACTKWETEGKGKLEFNWGCYSVGDNSISFEEESVISIKYKWSDYYKDYLLVILVDWWSNAD